MAEKEKTLKIHLSSEVPAAIVGGTLMTIPLCGRPVPANTVMHESILELWAKHKIYRGPLCRNCVTKSGVEFEPDQQEEQD